MSAAPLLVHWFRHGRVDSHHGDLSLNEVGRREVEEAGQRFGRLLNPDEKVFLLYAPTRRTQETASLLHRSLAQALLAARSPIRLHDPRMHEALRNPDLYVAGHRVDMVSSSEALADQLPFYGLSPDQLAELPFWKGFWSHPDRIGYWVNLPEPPGEDAEAVARRLFTFALSLLDLPRQQPHRYICVTHSPVMRAFLRRYLLGNDPGEPGYAETIDLDFSNGHVLSIDYREVHKEVVLPSGVLSAHDISKVRKSQKQRKNVRRPG